MIVALTACLAGGRVDAANRYWSGSGTWTTGTTNWGTTTGGPYNTATWSNSPADTAFFEGTAGTVTLTGSMTTSGITTFSVSGYVLTGGTIGLGGNISVASGATARIESILATATAFQKTSAGTLRLAGANTFSNGMVALGGLTEFESLADSGSPSALGSSGVLRTNGGVFSYVGTGHTSNRLFTFGQASGGAGSSHTLRSNGTGALNLTNTGSNDWGANNQDRSLTLGGTNASANTFSARISNNGSGIASVFKNDSGYWILTGSNSHSGGTTLTSGTLGLGNANALGTGTATFGNNATLRATVSATVSNIVSTGASSAVTATVDTQANAVTLSGSIGGSGNLAKLGSATLTLTSANNAYTGSTTISSGTLAIGGGGRLGGGSYAGTISNAGALAYASSANQTLSGTISGAGTLTKSGAGTLTLSNAGNTFSGGSTITEGVVSFASGALGTSGAVTMNGGALQWATGNTEDLSSRITLVSGSTATFDTNGNAVTLAGALGGGSVSAAVAKSGAGTLTLSASNAYLGATTISAGTLALTGDGNIQSSSGVNLSASGATLAMSGASGNRTLAALSGSAGSAVLLGGNGLTAGDATNSTFAGVISGSGGFTKAGAGTLSLTSIQDFTGAARVDAGILAIGGTNTLATASQIFVASGATLDTTAAGLAVGATQTLGGSGTVAGGFTIAGGATLAPGNSPGTLSATGVTTWGAGGNYNWQIYTVAGGAGSGTGWDLLDSTGSLTIAASGGNPFNINMWSLAGLPDTTGTVSDFNASYDYSFLIAEFDGGITGWDPSKFSLNTGSVNGTGGFTNDISGQGTFSLARGDTVSGGNANQIYIVYAAVPEPGTLALAGFGLAAAAWAARRRRRRAITAPRRGT